MNLLEMLILIERSHKLESQSRCVPNQLCTLLGRKWKAVLVFPNFVSPIKSSRLDMGSDAGIEMKGAWRGLSPSRIKKSMLYPSIPHLSSLLFAPPTHSCFWPPSAFSPPNEALFFYFRWMFSPNNPVADAGGVARLWKLLYWASFAHAGGL